MPPPSPVWAPSNKKGGPVQIHDASFRMTMKADGRMHESKTVVLKVKAPEVKK